ncbi:hypothetical protein B6V01_004210 [Methanosarcinales archaeon ex4572_44]|nr:MAG: hypothetical protein B6V01_004210 [Methanosarcinales archaeon ex4572_44]
MNKIEDITGSLIAEYEDTSEIDSTGWGILIQGSEKKEFENDKEVDFEDREGLHIRYLEFGKYKIGLIENDNHEVVGIKSVEIIKNLYSDEQMSKRYNYWDVEKYYEED